MKKSMKKLVFYFYAANDWDTNKANLVHFMCLERYNEIFDEVEIYISVDDRKNYDLINNVKEKFFSIFKKSEKLSFIVVDNTVYRESLIVKNYIIDKLGEDDLVFTGHNKGYTDITNPSYPEWFVIKWIVGCYYFSLEFMDEVIHKLYHEPMVMSYGSFLAHLIAPEGMELKFLGKYHWYYVGNFFWINSKKLKNFIDRNNITPPSLGDRFYAENILGNLYPINYPGQLLLADSHYSRYLEKFDDSFLDIETFLKLVYPGMTEEFDKLYTELYQKVI